MKEQFKKKHGLIHVDRGTPSSSWSCDNHMTLFSSSLFLDQFSSFQLSSDGSKLLYVAERNRPESVSFFKKQSGMVYRISESTCTYT